MKILFYIYVERVRANSRNWKIWRKAMLLTYAEQNKTWRRSDVTNTRGFKYLFRTNLEQSEDRCEVFWTIYITGKLYLNPSPWQLSKSQVGDQNNSWLHCNPHYKLGETFVSWWHFHDFSFFSCLPRKENNVRLFEKIK